MDRSLKNLCTMPLPFLLAGGLIGLYRITRRKKRPVMQTAAAATLGYLATRMARRSLSSTKEYDAHASFAVNCAPEQAYQLWRDFENLPNFMHHLASVKVLDGGRSEWVAQGPMHTQLRWTAEMTEDEAGRRIAWRSLPGSMVQNSGSVEFRQGPGQRGTLVMLRMVYVPPAGAAGKALAAVLGRDPAFTVREDLRRFKALIEAGEIPTTAGQPHGPRGVHGRTHQVLLREKQNMPAPSPLRRTA
jgi:uncharacterized membrane protein